MTRIEEIYKAAEVTAFRQAMNWIPIDRDGNGYETEVDTPSEELAKLIDNESDIN